MDFTESIVYLELYTKFNSMYIIDLNIRPTIIMILPDNSESMLKIKNK